MTKWTFYEYSESISPSWETNMLVPLTTPFGDPKCFLGECGSSAVCPALLFQAADSSFAYSVCTLMQNSTPISPIHKGDEGVFRKLQPKSPSVYAELNDLDTMQINSVLIWMLPEIWSGRQRVHYLHRAGFVQSSLPPHTLVAAPVWLVITLWPLAPCKITQVSTAHFILAFAKGI